MRYLIAGGSGLVGSRLTTMLKTQGHEVSLLSRNVFDHPEAFVYPWDPARCYIDPKAFEKTDIVVNLSGQGVADGRWTKKRKESIRASRIDSVKCLYKNIEDLAVKPTVMINASGKDYYGKHEFNHVSHEEDASGDTFLSKVCEAWEGEAQKFEKLGMRSVQLRIGVVLDKHGGALNEIARPVKLGLGAALGSGQQIIPWIHIDDLCQMMIHLSNTSTAVGPYNAVGFDPKTNEDFTISLAKCLRRPLWLPKVPAFVLKILLGEMSEIVLSGHYVSNDKILETGFQFRYKKLEDALGEIYNSD